MKSHHYLLFILCLAAFQSCALMQRAGVSPHVKSIQDRTFAENYAMPLSQEVAPQVRKEIKGEMKVMQKMTWAQVDTLRKGEVLKITFPIPSLFLPNDTDLWDKANVTLRPLLRMLKEERGYNLLIVVHSDSTGTPLYLQTLTQKRADALTRWFIANGVKSFKFATYPVAAAEPLVANNSMTNRAKNRRIDFYFVPNEQMKHVQHQKAKKRELPPWLYSIYSLF